ncbi:MAG: hypothetical protein JXR37_36575 [Kiritimatiellae bacterium]|nr:hypothetical protein [Kiritimatiellia bacterium]
MKDLGLQLRDTAVGCLLYVYAVPYVLVYVTTDRLSPLIAVLAVVLARPGTRAWAFVEYGITLLSVAAYMLAARRAEWLSAYSPWFVAAAVLQVLHLAWLDWLYRDRMVTERTRAARDAKYGRNALHPVLLRDAQDPLNAEGLARQLAVLNRLHPALQRILDRELAAGNLVVGVTDADWPATGDIDVELAQPFHDRYPTRFMGVRFRNYKRGELQERSRPHQEYRYRPFLRPRDTVHVVLSS